MTDCKPTLAGETSIAPILKFRATPHYLYVPHFIMHHYSVHGGFDMIAV